MDKTKSRRGKTIQMRYPAPYSWSETGPNDRKQVTMKKAASSYENNNKLKCTKPKPLTTGCDPYAPHLKYGIFPRNPQKEADTSKIVLNKSASDHQTEENKRQNIEHSEEPYFVIRPLQKQFTRQLSVSEVLHVDIHPQYGRNSLRAMSSYRFNKIIDQ